ncbi:MAG: GspE/PulE family protein [Planctomycetota bacterium]
MARESLRTRVQRHLGTEVPTPKGYQPGLNSFLSALASDGRMTRLQYAEFVAQETGHPKSDVAHTQLRAAPAPLGDREIYELVDEPQRLALANPLDLLAIDQLLRKHGEALELSVIEALETEEVESEADPVTLEQTMIEEREAVQSILQDLGADDADVEVVNSFDLADDVNELADEAPIIKLLNMILLQAFRDGASDIHIEAEELVTRVRFRVDGELREVMHPPKKFHNALVSRVKIMSDLDIAEKRSPQDGRMKLRLGGESVDVRVSTIPSVYGEKVVMRVLREDNLLIGLEDIGFNASQTELYRGIITRPYGIVLVTGPTGSGKTTTLYSTLRYLNSKAKNIITIEDPVEYQVENINQIQVNRKAGIDFASGLKSILRQDPDIIMIGEMRDEETASIAVKAALTGHLVFSTLHTNDALGTYERLQDMNVPPYLLTSAVIGVVAQRLVRTNCAKCSQPDHPDADLLAFVGIDCASAEGRTMKGVGCPACGGTGYRGRTGVYEILTPNQEVKKRVLAGTLGQGGDIPGYEPMGVHGRQLVLDGTISVEELCKVVRYASS